MSGRRYAVLIGNGIFSEDEPHLRTLRCPANDVHGLNALLASAQHGSYLVTALVDGTHDVARRVIYECLTKAKPDDLVLIYYSGHGKLDEEGNLYLVSKDTVIDALPPTSIPIEDVKRYIRDTRASVVVVILDCCFSGAVKKMFKGEVSDQASHAMRDLQGEGTFYLTASTDIQVAEEKEGDEYSLLTKYLIQGIREGTADSDDDGKVSFQELCSFVQKRVAPEGKQRPKVWALDTAGQVIVALTGKPASDTRRKAVTKKLYDLAAQGFLTDEIVGDLLAVVNRSSSSYIAPGLGVKELIDSLYSKSENTGEFVKEVFQRIHQLKEPHAIISRTPSKKTGEVEKEQTHLTFKLMAIVVSGVVLLLIVFGLFSTLNKKTGQEAENMIIKCDPECSTDTNFALSVSSAGPKNLRGRVQLAALLPQPTALKCWRLTVDGNSIDSGTGVKDFTSGDVFEDFNIRGIHPLGFNIFHRLSGDVLGISVSSYNVFAFTLLENSNTGAFSIQPITFSQFNRTKSCETESPEGAKGFPTGTMFFAFMVDGTQVVNQTPLNAIVVVR